MVKAVFNKHGVVDNSEEMLRLNWGEKFHVTIHAASYQGGVLAACSVKGSLFSASGPVTRKWVYGSYEQAEKELLQEARSTVERNMAQHSDNKTSLAGSQRLIDLIEERLCGQSELF